MERAGAAGKEETGALTQPQGLVLGLETSSNSGGAALLSSDGLVGSVCFHTKTLYSQRVLPGLEWLLAQTGRTTGEIDVVGVSVGPGSFTGLRIGLSVAKALAYASGAAMVGVGTLEALAVRAAGGADALVCPLLDARHGQVYAAVYQVSWSGGLPAVTAVMPEWAGPIEEVAGWITVPTIFTGDALPMAEERLAPSLGDKFIRPAVNRSLPHPEDVALLAMARAAAGQADNPLTIEPRYVRQSYMERRPPKH